jgi:hypothetical protein
MTGWRDPGPYWSTDSNNDPSKGALCYVMVEEAYRHRPFKVKIGRSKNPDQRRKQTPGQTLEVHTVLGQFMGDEFAIHAALERWRINEEKEWFQWCVEVRTYLLHLAPHLTQLPPPRDFGPSNEPPRLPYKSTRVGNPGSHAQKTDWVRDPEGKLAKWIIYFRAIELAGSDAALQVHFGHWKKRFGITNAILIEAVDHAMPEFFVRWPTRRKQCMNRLRYMFKRPKPDINPSAISGEHPHHSEWLARYEQHAHRIFIGRKRLTVEEVRKLFS